MWLGRAQQQADWMISDPLKDVELSTCKWIRWTSHNYRSGGDWGDSELLLQLRLRTGIGAAMSERENWMVDFAILTGLSIAIIPAKMFGIYNKHIGAYYAMVYRTGVIRDF